MTASDSPKQSSTRRRRPQPSRLLTLAVALPTLGLIAATLFGFLGSFAWWLDLFAHFRPHYVMAAAAVGLVGLLTRRWVWAGLAWVVVPINLLLFIGLIRTSPYTLTPGFPELELLHINVLTSNVHHDLVADYVREVEPAFLFLQETDDRWVAEMQQRLPNYDLLVTAPRGDNFGVAAFARRPLPDRFTLQSSGIVDLDPPTGLPAAEVRFRIDQTDLAILSLHPPPPMGEHKSRVRNRMLAAAGEWSNRQDRPHIVVGDLNATPWCAPIRQLRRDTGLDHARDGQSLQNSWPTFLPGFVRIPIDLCLLSPGWRVTRCQTGPDVGSDHLPLVIALEPPIPPRPPAPATIGAS